MFDFFCCCDICCARRCQKESGRSLPQTAKGGDETAAQTDLTGQNMRGSIQKMKWERRHLFSHIIRIETLKWNCEERQVLLEVLLQLSLEHCVV